VSGNGISWAVCKAVPCSRRITMHPTTQFLQAGCPSCRPTNSVKALKEQKFTSFVSTFTKSNGRCISTLIYPASCHLQCILSSRSATVCNWSQHTYAHKRTHRQTDRQTERRRPVGLHEDRDKNYSCSSGVNNWGRMGQVPPGAAGKGHKTASPKYFDYRAQERVR